ncbi:MAG: hypothetical protein ACJA2Y_001926 [Cycloclasticus pugetii]|jgi:hypothetical protein|uniref:Uncharacterized protein n=2 Tax=Cycloclasticus TaxID=34067 RepID=S5U0I4_9GAMM|nr:MULTISPECIES: hypothetical protein [Cycloclasticus]AFT66279.1 hypothetical protein Q91_0239 [Cycloclasticus sp. P1]AGS40738.1 hypothetical protein CYCME_2433 [Cycloclasticus zancles 78-ME]ATI01931.1 hypothetical protein CPC19_00195 [Cycloclasticus sp. PY97N]EPD13331.1 hypothetical protein L196_06800 [Cycloclasticus pugetii]SHJ16084.1 hypothetical protein SAMN05519226_1538 [Cycloclasticus pugetii]|tara:strand:+ start:1066 stop:1251 length:186 start_codon:yes stop_codon:yes gene_type:complete
MNMALWEQLALGAVALLVIFWFRPGIKAALKQSEEAEKDWAGILLPIAAVILFVIFLVLTS